MGKRIMVSTDTLAGEIDDMNNCLQKRMDGAHACIGALQGYCNEIALKGRAYERSKEYFAQTHLILYNQVLFACNESISLNNTILPTFASYVPDTMGFAADTHVIEEEIKRREGQNKDFRRKIEEYINKMISSPLTYWRPDNSGLIIWYQGRIWINEFTIERLQAIVDGLRAFDSDRAGIFDDCNELWKKITDAVKVMGDSATWDATSCNYAIPNLLKSRLGECCNFARAMQLSKQFGMTQSGELTTFELPPSQRMEVEAIMNSTASWNDKADQIRQVYERYLFNSFTDEAGNNPFLTYADDVMKAENTRNRDILVLIAEGKLGSALQNSGIDIRAVARSLSEDLIRIIPQKGDSMQKTVNFVNLVKTGAPADLKSNALGKALGGRNSDLDFSIWSRNWEPDMRGDYLGNYTFGYIGAGYWSRMDFDDVVESAALTTMSAGKPETGVGLYVDGMIAVSALRADNPDKTDAEIFCRIGAGLAQLKSDSYNVSKYAENIWNGNWGDNQGDSDMIGEGCDDYYRAYGIDKSKVIEEERKLW